MMASLIHWQLLQLTWDFSKQNWVVISLSNSYLDIETWKSNSILLLFQECFLLMTIASRLTSSSSYTFSTILTNPNTNIWTYLKKSWCMMKSLSRFQVTFILCLIWCSHAWTFGRWTWLTARSTTLIEILWIWNLQTI